MLYEHTHNGLTQEEAGAMFGKSGQYVSMLKHGRLKWFEQEKERSR